MESTRVKYGATERIFSTVTNASGVPVTGLTDVKLEIYRVSDGKYFDFNDSTFKASGWTTRQGAMTELSATNSPGVYYYDFATAGHSTVRVEESYLLTSTSATAANDPLYGELKVGGYVDEVGMGGAIVSANGKGAGITKKQLEQLAELIWKYKLADGMTAETALAQAAKDVAIDLTVLEKKIDAIEMPVTDLSPVIEKIDSVMDYTGQIQGILSEIKKMKNVNLENLEKVVDAFEIKVANMEQGLSKSLKTIPGLVKDVGEVLRIMEEVKNKAVEMGDMDKRFETMTSIMQKQKLDELTNKMDAMMKRILVAVTEHKYDILQELTLK